MSEINFDCLVFEMSFIRKLKQIPFEGFRGEIMFLTTWLINNQFTNGTQHHDDIILI